MTQQLANTITAVAFFAMIVGITAIVSYNRTRVRMHRMNIESGQPIPVKATKARPARGRHKTKRPTVVNMATGEVYEDEGVNETGHWASA